MDYRIQHFSHHHRLTLRLDDPDRAGENISCNVCDSICKDFRYNCKGCDFDIHKTCAETLPQEINHHPFHPQHPLSLLIRPSNSLEESQCHACGKKKRYKSTYHCSQCEFDLDVNCAALMPTKSTTESSSSSSHDKECPIDHHVVKPHQHPHPLFLCETEKKTDFYCSGCNLLIENGSIYVCIQCKAILHKSCSQLPQFIKHPFHPNHTLTLLRRPPYRGEFFCNACGVEHDGLTFHCSECEFFLDINCAFLMPVSTIDDHHPKEEHQIDYHHHPLILCKSSSKTKNNKILFVCKVCRLPFDDDGSSMYCCLDCSNLLHKSCAELPDEIHHSFHPDHPLKFRKYSKFYDCMACLRENKGFAYECLDCDFYIDIPCALSTPLLVNSQIHKHQLAFFSFVAKDLQCNICHHIRKKSPFFRCVACNFNVHIYCVPKLPPIASDGNHRHPLTLTKSLVKDYEDEGEDAEFYCDRCENERSLRDPTYYCAKCHYVAHVHCVIQEVVRFMEEEWSLAQKLGDKRLAISTESDTSQENGNELVSKVLIEEEEETTRPLLTNTNLHEHPLTFFKVVVDDLSCIICNLYSHSNFFRCVPCNFNLHLLCISKLPPTIFHQKHSWHTLTLTCSRVKDRYSGIHNGVGQCSACNEERQLCEPTYYCAQCRFVAHLRCAVPELAMDEDGSLAHKHGDTNLASTSTSIEENTINDVLATDEEGSLAHKFGDTKLALSSISSEGITINQMVREVLINFSDFSQQHDDQEEAIVVIRGKIKEEKEKIEALRKKYIQEHEFKVDALEKRLEALEKQCT